jgi:hypothetical protein
MLPHRFERICRVADHFAHPRSERRPLARHGKPVFAAGQFWEKILNRGWGGILPNGVHNLLPQGNRKRALQVFDQIVHVFYSD